ncbi:MAG: N-acetyltransferase [gamma proteobacterium symbiont of Bathyaustriella thionipta]|nr:N-acetyltransferase [gamma proteobacterium symbiont of Bathyaustriella thionipta]
MSRKNKIDIIPVNNRSRMQRFIKLPESLYRNDPHWIPPLRLERKLHLSDSNPYFQHAEWQSWLAVREGRDVGRISAQVDQLHLQTHQDGSGFFGLIEAMDDAEVFQQLTQTAENWLKAAGMQRLRGPFNLSINQESGLLIEGFDRPPSILMGHALPYYSSKLQDLGYAKAMDLLAFEIDSQFHSPRAMQALVQKTSENIQLRPLNKKDSGADFKLMCRIFNDAWSENWGFVPFTEAEFQDIGKTLALLLPNDFVQIASVDGEPAGMIVMLPDINPLIKDLQGRLFPSGLIKLLWRLKFKPPQHARIPLMGIGKAYRSSLIGTALAYRLVDALKKPAKTAGIQRTELSWALETNHNLIEIIESLGGKQSKRYRIYEKVLK